MKKCPLCGCGYAKRSKFCSKTCYDRDRYQRIQEIRKEQARTYRNENRDEINAKTRKARQENLTFFREREARYYRRNPNSKREAAARWQRENPDKVAERAGRRRSREAGFVVTDSFRRKSLHRAGNRCSYCSVPLDLKDRTRPNGLHWDHVVPLVKGGKHSEGNLVPSCATCNLRKQARYLIIFKKEAFRE